MPNMQNMNNVFMPGMIQNFPNAYQPGNMNMNMQKYIMMLGNQNQNNLPFNMGGGQNWTEIYANNETNNNAEPNKINFIFKTTQGVRRVLLVEHGTTIHDLIKKYFTIMGKPELINNKKDICLLSNARTLQFDDETPIEQYFKNLSVVNIVVNDVKELIGA